MAGFAVSLYVMITPPYLKPGDRISIVSPARSIRPEEVEPAIRLFESWGLQVVRGRNLFATYNQFAGTDQERLTDLQQALNDASIKTVVFSRGGYGTVRIIDRLDFRAFRKHPKWIVGYSDATVLHSHIHQHFGIETLHAMMPVNYFEGQELSQPAETLRQALFGEKIEYRVPSEGPLRRGSAMATLTGGNLSIIYSLSGTASDLTTRGKILFLEDVDEYLYHIDRMMVSLKRSGKLQGLAGLIVGGMTRMRDNAVPYGKTAEEIIAEAVAEYAFPVCFGFPAGHQDNNQALVLGREVSLDVSDIIRLDF